MIVEGILLVVVLCVSVVIILLVLLLLGENIIMFVCLMVCLKSDKFCFRVFGIGEWVFLYVL